MELFIHHQRHFGFLVRPRANQINLSAAVFFSRRSQELDMTRNTKLANGKCKG
jgi:hypothetical protein